MRFSEFGHRHIGHAAADATYEVLVTREICIEAADRFGGADAANKIFAREEFQCPVDGCGRQPPEVTQPFEDRVRGWMRGIFDEGAIDGEALRSDANATSPA